MMRAMRAAMLAAVGLTVAAPAPALLMPGATTVERPTKQKKRRTSPQPGSKTRWIQREVEEAQRSADAGGLRPAGRLYRALARDGILQGLLNTRSGGLVRLPKRFSGSPAGVAYLAGAGGVAGRFDVHFPSAELAKLARDGFVMGVGIAEFIERIDPRTCQPIRVLVRLDPEFLVYRWFEDRWYYQSAHGLIPITPGDGRFVLYLPGGMQEPWNAGSWAALARAYISKEHAILYRENWNAKLAHPARVATFPQGSTEIQKQSWFQKVMAWGVNTVFGLLPGYDVKLLESNGRGYESFKETIADANQEFMVNVAGQVVTVTGGAGFANADIHATIRGDLIEGDGLSLAATLCEQALPYVLEGIIPIGERTDFAWDTRPAMNRKDEADALGAAAKAITDLIAALAAAGLKPDVLALAQKFGIPIDIGAGSAATTSSSTPSAAAAVAPTIAANDTSASGWSPDLLADRMTDHGIDRCEHGHLNRCHLCGIERVRDYELDEDGNVVRDQDGNVVWTIGWRAISEDEEVAA
jgi:hypothetical protein